LKKNCSGLHSENLSKVLVIGSLVTGPGKKGIKISEKDAEKFENGIRPKFISEK